MKKLKNISVVVFLISFLSAGAKELEKEEVSLNGDQTLILELSRVNEGTLILFEDNQGVVLFKDNLRTNGKYNKTLNLGMVPMGTYLLKVDKKFATKMWKIQKTSKGIELIGNSSIVNAKPYFRVKEKLVDVFMSNPTKGSISLLVEDRYGKVLTELKDVNEVFSKTLDFSKVRKGEYYVTVLKGKERFKEKVIIK